MLRTVTSMGMRNHFLFLGLMIFLSAPALAASYYECHAENLIPSVLIQNIKIWLEPTGVRALVDYRGDSKPWSSVSEKPGSDFYVEYAKLRGDYKLLHFAKPPGGRYSFTVNFGETDGVLTQETAQSAHVEILDQVFLICKVSSHDLAGTETSSTPDTEL